MKPELIQSQKQQLILSPQLRQYLKLLQLPILDLQQSVEQELTQNPVLEEVRDAAAPQEADEESQEPPSNANADGGELKFDETLDQISELDEETREDFYRHADLSEENTFDARKRKDFQERLISKGPTLADYLPPLYP